MAPQGASSPAPGAQPTTIESFFLPTGKNAGRIVLKLASAHSISEAEFIAGRQLMVPASELPALGPDTFYVSDLVGCTLLDGTTPIGEVTDVEFAMSPDGRTRLPDAVPLLAIRRPNAPAEAEITLIPFARAYLQAVDLTARRIVMNLPPGIFDDDPTTS